MWSWRKKIHYKKLKTETVTQQFQKYPQASLTSVSEDHSIIHLNKEDSQFTEAWRHHQAILRLHAKDLTHGAIAKYVDGDSTDGEFEVLQ